MLFSGNLRKDWELLHKLESKENCEKWEELLKAELKTGIRNLLRARNRCEEETIYKWQSYCGHWDSRYCRIEYEGIPTEEEIKEYIEEEWQHWYNPYNDGRDCTGVWFTSFIYVFPIPALNKTIVYHMQNMDV